MSCLNKLRRSSVRECHVRLTGERAEIANLLNNAPIVLEKNVSDNADYQTRLSLMRNMSLSRVTSYENSVRSVRVKRTNVPTGAPESILESQSGVIGTCSLSGSYEDLAREAISCTQAFLDKNHVSPDDPVDKRRKFLFFIESLLHSSWKKLGLPLVDRINLSAHSSTLVNEVQTLEAAFPKLSISPDTGGYGVDNNNAPPHENQERVVHIDSEDWISRVNLYCQKNYINFPVYEYVQDGSRFQCKAWMNGVHTVSSGWHVTKNKAKQSAARMLFDRFDKKFVAQSGRGHFKKTKKKKSKQKRRNSDEVAPPESVPVDSIPVFHVDDLPNVPVTDHQMSTWKKEFRTPYSGALPVPQQDEDFIVLGIPFPSGTVYVTMCKSDPNTVSFSTVSAEDAMMKALAKRNDDDFKAQSGEIFSVFVGFTNAVVVVAVVFLLLRDFFRSNRAIVNTVNNGFDMAVDTVARSLSRKYLTPDVVNGAVAAVSDKLIDSVRAKIPIKEMDNFVEVATDRLSSKIVHTAQEQLPFLTKLSDLSNGLAQAAIQPPSMMDVISNYVGVSKNKLKIAEHIAAACSYAALVAMSNGIVQTSLATYLYARGLVKDEWSELIFKWVPILSRAAKQLRQPMELQAQGGPDENGSTLRTALRGIAHTISPFSSTQTSKVESDAMMNLTRANHAIRSIESLAQWLYNLVFHAFELAYMQTIGVPFTKTAQEADIVDQAIAWESGVTEWRSKVPPVDKRSNAQLERTIWMAKRGNEITYDLHKMNFNVANFTYFHQLHNTMVHEMNQASDLLKTARAREEPFCIYLRGPPGAGKTRLIKILCSMYMKMKKNQDITDDDFYLRKTMNEYWEGYRYQAVALWDDLLQSKDKEIRAREAYEIIFAVNEAAYQLHMAALESKSGTYFTSDVVAITTNAKGLEDLPLVDVRAFKRRRHLVLEVVLGPSDPQVVELYTPVMGAEIADFVSKWKFDLLNRMDDKKILHGISFPAVVALMADMIEERKKLCAEPLAKLAFDHSKIQKVIELSAKGPFEKSCLPENYLDNRMEAQGGPVQEIDVWLTTNLPQLRPMPHEDGLRNRILAGLSVDSNLIVPDDKIDTMLINDEACWSPDSVHWYRITNGRLMWKVDDHSKREFLEAFKKKKEVELLFARLEADDPEMVTEGLLDNDPHKYCLKEDARIQNGPIVLRKCKACFPRTFADLARWKNEHPALATTATVLGALAGVFAIGGIGLMIFKMMSGKGPVDSEDEDEEVSAQSPVVSVPKTPVKHVKGPKLEPKSFAAQSGESQGGVLATRVIASQVWTLEVRTDMLGKPFFQPTNCTALANGLVLMNYHPLSVALSTKSSFALLFNGIEWLPGSDFSMSYDETYDLCLLFFNTKEPTKKSKQSDLFKGVRDIRSHFVKDSDVPHLHSVGDVTIVTRRNGQSVFLSAVNGALDEDVSYTTKNGEEFTKISGIKVSTTTQSGDCGSPYVLMNNQFPRHLVGIHVAGKRGVGVSTLVTQEMIETLKSGVADILRSPTEEIMVAQSGDLLGSLRSEQPFDGEDFELEVQIVKKEFIDSGMLDLNCTQPSSGMEGLRHCRLIGYLKTQFVPYQPSKTEIRKSIGYGHFRPVLTAPAALKRTSRGDPLHLAQIKEDVPDFPVHPKICWIMNVLAEKKALSLVPKSNFVRKLTRLEAINGVVGVEHLGPLDMSKSDGFPLNVENRGRNQNAAGTAGKLKHVQIVGYGINGEPQYDYIPNTHAEKLYTDTLNGKRLGTCYCEFKKDERRPLEKVAALKTRLIKGGSMSKLIVDRQYFGAFSAAIMDNHNENSCKLGLNAADCHEARILHDWMLAGKSPMDVKWAWADVSGMDINTPYVSSYYADKVARFWYAFYDPACSTADDALRKWSMKCDRYSIRVCGNVVRMMDHQNVSGSFLTTPRNSFAIEFEETVCKILSYELKVPPELFSHADQLYNMVVTREEWIILGYPDHDIRNAIGVASRHFRIATFGDDNGYNDIDETIPMTLMVPLMKKFFNRELTDYKKSTELVPYHSYGEAQFLKRGIVVRSGIGYLPLDADVCWEMLNWCTKSVTKREGFVINAHAALSEMVLHGWESYNEMAQKIVPFATKHGLMSHPLLQKALDYQHLLMTYVSGGSAVPRYMAQSGAISDRPVYNMRDAFKDQFPGLIDARMIIKNGFNYGEVVRDVTTLIKRFHKFNTTVSPFLDWRTFLDPTGANIFRMIAQSYCFCRGSVRFVVSPKPGAGAFSGRMEASVKQLVSPLASPSESMEDSNDIKLGGSGYYFQDTSVRPVLEFEVPYGNTYNFYLTVPYATWENETYRMNVGYLQGTRSSDGAVVTPTVFNLWMAPGDDFSFGWLKTPSHLMYVIPTKDKEKLSAQSGDVHKESMAAKARGFLSATAKTMRDIVVTVKGIDIIKKFVSGASITQSVMSLASFALLDRPIDLRDPDRIMAVSTDNMVHGRGPWVGTKIAMEPENRVTKDTLSVFGTEEEMSYSKVLGTPVLLAVFSIDNSVNPLSIIWSAPVCPTMAKWHIDTGIVHYHNGPCANLALLHRAWRGGMKFYIQASCSAFVTARVRLMWSPSAHHVPPDVSDGGGDIISQIWTINGDSSTAFTVPYLADTDYKSIVPYHTVSDSTQSSLFVSNNLDECNGMLQIALVNKVSSGDTVTEAKIYFNVWVAGAEDLLLYYPCDLNSSFIAQSGEITSSQKLEGSEHQENTQLPNETQQLTSFVDAIGVERNDALIVPKIYSDVDPYPDQGLSNILSRPYSLDFEWDSSSAVGDILFDLDFPVIQLTNFLNLADKLNKFQFFQAGVKVELRLNGTRFHSGKLLISFLPHYSPHIGSGDYGPFNDLYGASCSPHVIVSANTSEVVTFEIPYVNPAPFINLSHLNLDDGRGEIGHATCFVLNPLLSSATATVPTVTISVTMSFVNPKVAGPTYYTVSTLGEPRTGKLRKTRKDPDSNSN